MFTNMIRKGDKIRLRNGWLGTMMDNRAGNIRMAEVEGFYTEIGSIYASDIYAVYKDGTWITTTMTDKQKKFLKGGYSR
jgi:hypothetical protein